MVSDVDDHAASLSDAGTASIGIEPTRPFDPVAFEAAIQALLRACGVDDTQLTTGHMKSTPKRVRELWQQRLLGGAGADLAGILGNGFDDAREDLVVIRGISVHGVCPHHLVPFRGTAHVAYRPGGRLHGFGRIARLVDAISHRFTYQEWMTRDIAQAMVTLGKAQGCAVVVECEQLCLLLGEDRRGDERVMTTAFSGCFEGSAADAVAARAEVLRTLELPRSI